MRAGGFGAAAELLLDEWAESVRRRAAALADVRALPRTARRRRGLPAVEADAGALGDREAEATGVQWDRLEALRAIAIAALLENEPARAADALRAVSTTPFASTSTSRASSRSLRPRRGARRARRVDEAAAVTAAARPARRRAAPSMGARCHAPRRRRHRACIRAVRRAASRADRSGGSRPRRARACVRPRPDAARAGTRPPAREEVGHGARTLEQAASRFDELGSPGWADAARAELARIGARKPQQTRRADADRAARGRARDRGDVEQGDRPGALRHRQHRRGAPVARLREARHPLSRATRARIRRAPVGRSKDSGFPQFRPCWSGRTVEP